MSNRLLVRAALATLTLLAAATPLVVQAQESAPTAPTGTTLKTYDLKAEALLQRAADRMKAAPSLSGRVESITNYPATEDRPAWKERVVKTVQLQKPNRVYSEVATDRQTPQGKTTRNMAYVSNGKQKLWLDATSKLYNIAPVLPLTKEAWAENFGEFFFTEFFDTAASDVQLARTNKQNGTLVSLSMAPDADWGGVPCFVVEERDVPRSGVSKDGATDLFRIYIGKKDGLLRGYHLESQPTGNQKAMETADTVVTKLVVGGKLHASVFTANVTGYKKFVAPVRPPLLTAGTVAPDFTVVDKDGKPVKLSDFRGKIVVLDFWATWCGPCIASLPHTTEVARKTADKGVVVFAVNVADKQEAFDKWLPAHPEFSTLTFAIDPTPGKGKSVASKLYNVSGIPTQYVIDRDGKIVTSFVGFSGPTDDLEKAIAKADGKADAGAQK